MCVHANKYCVHCKCVCVCVCVCVYTLDLRALTDTHTYSHKCTKTDAHTHTHIHQYQHLSLGNYQYEITINRHGNGNHISEYEITFNHFPSLFVYIFIHVQLLHCTAHEMTILIYFRQMGKIMNSHHVLHPRVPLQLNFYCYALQTSDTVYKNVIFWVLQPIGMNRSHCKDEHECT